MLRKKVYYEKRRQDQASRNNSLRLKVRWREQAGELNLSRNSHRTKRKTSTMESWFLKEGLRTEWPENKQLERNAP